jgi:hypothetical protein
MATLSISGSLVLSRSSKKVNLGTQSAGNQRRYVSSLVETSETTRATSYSKNLVIGRSVRENKRDQQELSMVMVVY